MELMIGCGMLLCRLDDLVVGAPFFSESLYDQGRVYVYLTSVKVGTSHPYCVHELLCELSVEWIEPATEPSVEW